MDWLYLTVFFLLLLAILLGVVLAFFLPKAAPFLIGGVSLDIVASSFMVFCLARGLGRGPIQSLMTWRYIRSFEAIASSRPQRGHVV